MKNKRYSDIRDGLLRAASLLPRGMRMANSARAATEKACEETRRVPVFGSPVEILILATSRAEVTLRRKTLLREPWTTHWIEHFIRPGEVLFDVGANVGVFSLLCARVHRRPGMVYAFEPAFQNFNALCRNILLNGCGEAIVPIPLALYSETTTTTFKYRSLDPGAARHAMGERSLEVKPGSPYSPPAYEQTVLATELDKLRDLYRLPVPAHIKIDVDGAEDAVLAGAAATLRHPGVRTAMVESEAGGERGEIVQRMERAGLKLAREFDKQNSTAAADIFFARDPGALAECLSQAPAKMSRAQLRKVGA